MPSILFVCTANQCRSPMAQALFERRAAQMDQRIKHNAQLNWRVASAGTLAERGHPAIPNSIAVMREIGIDLTAHRSQPVTPELLGHFELVLAMSRHHKESLRAEFPEHAQRIHLLSELAGVGYDIPDPAGGDVADVRRVSREMDRLLERGTAKILEKLGLHDLAGRWLSENAPRAPASNASGTALRATERRVQAPEPDATCEPVQDVIPANPTIRVHVSADVGATARIGADSSVWNNAQVRDGAIIGERCVIGKNVYIDADVRIGDRVKIQNNVSVFHGVTLEDGVFVGPHVCFTNDLQPRAIDKNGALKGVADWQVTPTLVKYGAGIGANSTIRCGVTIGRWAMVGAGSVVTRDVPDFGLVYGNPARLRGFVCRCGAKLALSDVAGVRTGTCAACGESIAPL